MTETLRQDLLDVASALHEARLQAESGASVDLAGLDVRIGSLCATATRTGRAVLVEIETVLTALDSLHDALARQREVQLAAPHTNRQRAAAAYGRTPLPPPPAEDP